MRTFIVGDTHGNFDLIDGLFENLEKAGGFVDDENTVTLKVHIGDLINGVGENTADILVLEKGRELFDMIILGNHEYPYFGGPAFSGFRHDSQIKRELHRLYEDRILVPSLWIEGNWLATHAGLNRDYGFEGANVASKMINDRFDLDPTDSLFSAIGRKRGGSDRFGGILWADVSEPKHGAFHQIFGHTPMLDGPTIVTDDAGFMRVNIDIGGKLGASLGGMMIVDGEPEAFYSFVRPDHKEYLDELFDSIEYK